jgi:hypothetical protein
MIPAWLLRPAAVRGSLAALVAAIALTVVTAIRAVTVEPMPTVPAQAPVQLAVAQQGVPRTPNHLIAGAVDAAPFTPSREAAAPQQGASPDVAPAASGDLLLAGTVVSADGSFILVSVGGGSPKVARVGDEVGGYKLRSIAQGRALFMRISDGERLELVVPRSRR